MSNKKAHHEEHVDETWLIPYADMLTLLLALFIVMFAMSKTDKEKFEKVSEQFNIIFSGGSGFLEGEGNSVIPMKNFNKESSPGTIENNKMNGIREFLEGEIKKEGYSDEIKLVLNNEGLEISIQDTVLFASGDANVLNDVTHILYTITKVLSGIENTVKIVGHTDNVPIKNSKFSSNWDLSAARAINVMQFFVDKGNLLPNRFIVQGNAEYSPKYDNSTEEGRANNRRVEIYIIRKYPLKTEEVKATPE